MSSDALKAPFPYFGGKSTVAELVWTALGDCRHYIEPFFGSGAVLLNRPLEHNFTCETVCDADGYVANVWRAIQHAPDEVAKWCDWPVNHADLSARKRRLLANEARLLENLIASDDWYDAKLAGYWVWAASCWIGSGLTYIGQIPHVSDGGKGVHACNPNIHQWMRELAARLRYVRVVCGDWTRVCGGKWQERMSPCGIFFDPPYAVDDRDTDIYHKESLDVAHKVREWAIPRGENPKYRIVIAGYEEHADELEAAGWTAQSWKAKGGYGNVARTKAGGQGKANRHREMLYFSPHCLSRATHNQTELFA